MPDWFKPGATRPGQRPGARPDGPIANRPEGRPRPDGDGPLANRPGDRPGIGDRPGVLPERPGNRPGVRPPGNRPRPPIARPPIARPLPPRYPWRPGHPGYGRYRYGYWWGAATVVGLTNWVTPVWTTPVYYSYGDGGSVYYEGDTVYVDGDEYASAPEYYDQATTIATSAPAWTDEEAEEVDWMPLGVFALTQEGVNASSMYLQLAISKDAVIAGTFYNESTGVTHPVEGMVDQESQRAAWRAADDTNPDIVMETGVYNLTEEETDVLVHFGPDETQVWKMARLDEADMPAETEQEAAE